MALLELGEGRLLLDLNFNETPGVIGSYLIPQEEGWTAVEVGPAACHDTFMRGLAEAGIAPVEVRNVFVSHVHLDHAGGTGALVEDLPKATFHVHDVGLPHLVDPSRLERSAMRVWGEAGMALWGGLIPVPFPRVHGLHGGERYPIEKGFLAVIPAPGHADHHLAFYDSALNAVMTGDGAGVLLPGSSHIRPALPPPELDVGKLLSSLEKMRSWAPSKLLFSHFGPAEKAIGRLTEAEENVKWWVRIAEETFRKSPSVDALARALEKADIDRASADGEQSSVIRRSEMISGYQMAAMGLFRYLSQKDGVGKTPSKEDIETRVDKPVTR